MSALPLFMTVSELASRAGLTRQWLNVRVDKGEVPGCSRKANGRLQIEPSALLEKWIRAQNKKQLEKSKLPSFLADKQMECVPEGANFLTAEDLAKLVGESPRTIRRKVAENGIPSTFLIGTRQRIMFDHTSALEKWITRQRLRAELRLPPDKFWGGGRGLKWSNPLYLTCRKIQSATLAAEQLIHDNQLSDWSTKDLEAVLLEFEKFLETVHLPMFEEWNRRQETA
jgi:excisionase family DNA binding protein